MAMQKEKEDKAQRAAEKTAARQKAREERIEQELAKIRAERAASLLAAQAAMQQLRTQQRESLSRTATARSVALCEVRCLPALLADGTGARAAYEQQGLCIQQELPKLQQIECRLHCVLYASM